MRVRMHYKLMPPSMVLFFSLCCCSLFSTSNAHGMHIAYAYDAHAQQHAFIRNCREFFFLFVGRFLYCVWQTEPLCHSSGTTTAAAALWAHVYIGASVQI